MNWLASPQTDDDLIAARNFIGADTERAARDFLDAAFETFNLLAQFPQMGPLAKFSDPSLQGMRYFVLPPPFSRWLIFYQLHAAGGLCVPAFKSHPSLYLPHACLLNPIAPLSPPILLF